MTAEDLMAYVRYRVRLTVLGLSAVGVLAAGSLLPWASVNDRKFHPWGQMPHSVPTTGVTLFVALTLITAVVALSWPTWGTAAAAAITAGVEVGLQVRMWLGMGDGNDLELKPGLLMTMGACLGLMVVLAPTAWRGPAQPEL